VQNRRKGLRS